MKFITAGNYVSINKVSQHNLSEFIALSEIWLAKAIKGVLV